ncbi:geranylgeranyl reductase family protein [Natranaeroarchaeum aerophilus]|uniref:Geranylgeranyl reductase family protein n=1 Tax=Natranaeroarchaeum aerophilus TaxID=2917711 RepID=A0AAE3FR04_9EURY|nr:geranylgeranyl reductase family protein [Natranaeroarchaeum aerophilus]MCL9813500.1 geranylgeranyl reductase family protein [Natranaeroarchaeum aerophilus]
MYDFVVVGCGPPGARFARRASEEGHDVLVFEKGEIGDPLACSGHVSTDIWDFTGPDARNELLQNEIRGARFHVDEPQRTANSADERAREAGRQLDHAGLFYRDETISNVIDRVGLDRHLADLARDAGADVRDHHTVTEIEEHEDRVTVTASTPEDTITVEGKMVAGCDGPRSRVRDALGLDDPDELLHGVLGFDPTPDHADYVDVHLTAPRFFAWRIPRGDAGVEYGLAAPPGDNVRELFERLQTGYGVDLDRTCSGAIPIGPPERITTRRGFLIGDAAAQTKPFTGGGILYSMTAADHAARTIDPDWPPTLQAYEHAWREELSREIQLGHLLRRAYSLPEPIQRTGLRALSGEIGVHMDRPTSLFSREQLGALLSR